MLKHWRILAWLLPLLFMFGCAPVHGPEANIPVEPLEPGGFVPLDRLNEYRLSTGDVLDITYQFESSPQPEYKIQLMDVVRVKFPSMPDQNTTQTVRPDGKISLPYIGEVKVLEMTPDQATQTIRGAYQNVLYRPDVYVELEKYGEEIAELKRAITTNTRGQSKLIRVREDGMATFLMLGDIAATGKTIPELSVEINQAYQKINNQLKVDISLNQAADKNYYVLGEVNNPGSYSVDRPVTTLQLLALAGGTTEDAILSESIVMRRHGRTMIAQRVNLKNPLALDPTASLTFVEPGDVLYVPRRRIADAAHLMSQLWTIIYFRGFSVSFGYDLRLDERLQNQ